MNCTPQLNLRIEEQLASGSCGPVWRGVLLDSNKPVAVKEIVGSEAIEACRAECSTLLTVNGDRIVPFVGTSETQVPQHHFYLLTELATGGSLARALQSHPKRNDLATLVGWALDVVAALESLHSRTPPVLHLGVKPQNVLLFENDVAKLCDFHLSRITAHIQTTAHGSLGAIRYAAPEQPPLAVDTEPSPATDVYGLGGVLYMMALKVEPWENVRFSSMARKKMERIALPFPLPDGLHGGLAALAAECLNPVPAARPTLQQVAGRLSALREVARAESVLTAKEALMDLTQLQEREVDKLRADLSTALSEVDRLKREAAAVSQSQLAIKQVLALRGGLVAWPSDITDECASAIATSLFEIGGSFQNSDRKVKGYELKSVEIIHNPTLSNGFACECDRFKLLRQNNPTLFHHKYDGDEQYQAIRILKTLFHPVLPGVCVGPRTLTVYHGCRASVARKIAQAGFVTLSSTDDGFFGNGIYVTPNAEYACGYASGKLTPSSPPEPHSADHPDWFSVVLSAAVVSLVYPVTRQKDYLPGKNKSTWFGMPLNSGYDAHFALVEKANGFQATDPANAQYGELCLSQCAALSPLAILWVSRAIEKK